MKRIIDLLKETFKEWSEDKATRLAAALAYYTVFSIAPFLIVVIAVVGLVFGQEAVRGEIVGQLQGLIGQEGAQMIESLIQSAYKPGAGIIATVVGLVTLLLGAAGVFGQLQDALNTVWDVEKKPSGGILGVIKTRFLSFSMVLGVAFLLLVSLVVSAGLAAVDQVFRGILPIAEFLMQLVNFVVSFGITTLLFAMIYKVLPDVEIAWRDVLIGAAATALLFNLGKFALGLYLGNSAVGSTYGAAGSLVIILLWIYYSAQILLLGAEFTQVYARRYGSHLRPEADAVAERTDVQTARPALTPALALNQSLDDRGTPPISPVAPVYTTSATYEPPQKPVNPIISLFTMVVIMVVSWVLGGRGGREQSANRYTSDYR
ncbi:MAG: YihY/virulence factor BrkB family protein [bacterium]|nr:YihY/virulence factor BrkB family protein [bacterium]